MNMIIKFFLRNSFIFVISGFAYFNVSIAQSSLSPSINPQQASLIQGALGGSMLGGNSSGMSAGAMNGGVNVLGNNIIQGSDSFAPTGTNSSPSSDSFAPTGTNSSPSLVKPLESNDFQKFVLQVTGEQYSLFGVNFFDNLKTKQGLFSPNVNSTVTSDYILGSGDQLLIRAWGSVEINYKAVIDKNGLISLPKIGTIALTGVKMADAESVIRQSISNIYKGFSLSVSMGETRSITVYVVGQARRPGSYALSGLSTISTALFASGGPNSIGSMRRVQLKRANKVISEFDLYQFLSQGQSSGDIKLIDGDVIFMPASLGYVGLIGKVNVPAIYELKSTDETLDQLLSVAGGLPVTADPRRASLERLEAAMDQPRVVSNLDLIHGGLQTKLKVGDLINFFSINPELQNSVTLRGAISTPMRKAWKEGLRVHDLIPSRDILITANSLRFQNEALFDVNERERIQRLKEEIPKDLIQNNSNLNEERQQKQASRLLSQQPIVDDNNLQTSTGRVGQIRDEINFDYAVIERINRKDLSVSLIPFNLGLAIDSINSPDNVLLENGDIVTIFTVDDIRLPIAKRHIFVKLEGEVVRPGIYKASPNDTLMNVVKRAGGLTQEAYLFGSAFYRDEVRLSQIQNLEKLTNRLERESNASLIELAQSNGASTNPAIVQAKINSAQQAQREALARIKNVKPEGRISLGLPQEMFLSLNELPSLHLQNNDRFFVPSMPDFVYIFGAVNTESALLFKKDLTVTDYLSQSGVGSGADKDSLILIRSDGSVLTNQSSWRNQVLAANVLPGDTIVVPDKLDRETFWSTFFRSALDGTQIFFQLGLGAAAIKTLKN